MNRSKESTVEPYTDKSAAIKKAGKRYMGGMLVLTASTFICKIIGLLFKIPMLALIGIEGMAYFSSAYHIYLLLLTLSTAGLPVALSMMTAKAYEQGRVSLVARIWRTSLTILLPLGLLGTAVLYFGAGYFAQKISIPSAEASIKAISPTLFFICATSAARGYFQGHEIMVPTAVSQLIESLGKLILGMGFAYYAIKRGAESPAVASAAISGLTVGVAIGTLYIFVKKLWFKPKTVYSECEAALPDHFAIAKEMLLLAFPITVSSSVTGIAGLADTALITDRLIASGWSYDTAISLYSGYTNLVIPLYNLPTTLIAAVSLSLVPAISAAIAANDSERASSIRSSAIRISVAAAIPASMGLAFFSHQILSLIYPRQISAVNTTSPLLSVLSAAVFFSCIITVTNAVLQSYRHTVLPIVSIAVGTAVKLISEYFLVATSLGIYGAPISTLLCSITVSLLNIIFMKKYTPSNGGRELASLLRALVSSAISVLCAAAVYCLSFRLLQSNSLSLMAAIFVAVAVYTVLAIRFGAVLTSDILTLPKGDKITLLLKKIKIIK